MYKRFCIVLYGACEQVVLYLWLFRGKNRQPFFREPKELNQLAGFPQGHDGYQLARPLHRIYI